MTSHGQFWVSGGLGQSRGWDLPHLDEGILGDSGKDVIIEGVPVKVQVVRTALQEGRVEDSSGVGSGQDGNSSTGSSPWNTEELGIGTDDTVVDGTIWTQVGPVQFFLGTFANDVSVLGLSDHLDHLLGG